MIRTGRPLPHLARVWNARDLREEARALSSQIVLTTPASTWEQIAEEKWLSATSAVAGLSVTTVLTTPERDLDTLILAAGIINDDTATQFYHVELSDLADTVRVPLITSIGVVGGGGRLSLTNLPILALKGSILTWSRLAATAGTTFDIRLRFLWVRRGDPIQFPGW